MRNITNFQSIKITFCSLLCVFTFFSFAQNYSSNQRNFWSHIEYGGGIGLSVGNEYFSGSLAPFALYRFSPYVATGVGLNFSYSSQKDVFKSTVVGGSIIGLFNPFRELQVSTEFEQLYVTRNFDDRYITNLDENYWYPALFLGLGYSSRNVTVGIRFDVLYDRDKSIYSESWMPFVRFSF